MITHAELMAIPSDPREKTDIERECLETVRRGEILEGAMIIPADEWNTRLSCCAERLEAYDAATGGRPEQAKETR